MDAFVWFLGCLVVVQFAVSTTRPNLNAQVWGSNKFFSTAHLALFEYTCFSFSRFAHDRCVKLRNMLVKIYKIVPRFGAITMPTEKKENEQRKPSYFLFKFLCFRACGGPTRNPIR